MISGKTHGVPYRALLLEQPVNRLPQAMTQPLVSIGMPVYNGQRFLKQALESLLAQDFANFEIHISDNASEDSTPDICREFASRDGRIRYVRQAENLGAEANFDFVLSRAAGKYFMWASHDDLWDPVFLRELVSFFLREPEHVLVFPGMDEIDDSGAVLRRFSALPVLARFKRPVARLKTYLSMEGKQGKASVVYGLMKTEAVRRTGGIRHCCGAGISWDNLFVFGLLTFGPFGAVDPVLFHKRTRPAPAHSAPRLTRNRQASRTLHRYFNGYRTIIRDTEALTRRQKRELTLLAALLEVKAHAKAWRI